MKKRILVVEDDPDLRKFLELFLIENGFEVFATNNKRDALKLCAHEQPHLVILDVYLSGELGTDIALAIEKDRLYYGTPFIIAISGTVGGDYIRSEEFKEQNHVHCFVKKPFDAEQLLKSINQFLVN